MERLAQFRFFCSHNVFTVSDATIEPWSEPYGLDGLSEDERSAQLNRGWYKSEHSINVRTLAQSYVNRIDVYRTTSHPTATDADRVLAFNLSLPSGTLMIFGLDYGETVNVGVGDYALYCREYNLGIEPPFDAPPLEHHEFLRRDDLERFELVLVPGRAVREGVIYGSPLLEGS